ncbi:MAG: hypothetical protein WBV36_21775 [Terriglobales bacterium]
MSYDPGRPAQRSTSQLSILLITFTLMVLALQAQGQQVHQLFYNNSGWADANLAGSLTSPNTGVGAFTTTPNNSQHVFYISNTGDVHQLYNVGGGWTDQDLTAQTGGVPANGNSNVVGFSNQNFQYVFYIGADFNIYELFYNNSDWSYTNLCVAYGIPIGEGAQLTAFATSDNSLHVYYVTPEAHVIQTYNVGNGWEFQDLTAQTGGPQAQGRYLTGFSSANLQYVYYVAFEGDVHQLFYNNAKWTDEDLTALAKTVPSPQYPDGGISAMLVPGTKKLRVYYIGTNNHLIQLASTNNKKWTGADLTKKTKGPLADPSNGIVAFATTPNNQIHVFYASGGHVNQLFLPTPATKWSNTDLTALTHGGLAEYSGAMSGFSIANEQYVYYVAH